MRRWSWSSRPCVAVGHRFRLRVEPGGDFRRVLEPLVAPFELAADAQVDGSYEVVVDHGARLPYTLSFQGERVAGGNRASDLAEPLGWHINQQVIARSVRHHVLLHAAAAVRSGVTVILPGDQEHGKTTTVAGLLRAGFDYVTDEAVAIDPASGWITPFPKTLSLDPGSWELFPECAPDPVVPWVRQWQVPAERLGSRVVRRPVPPPRVVVFPEYVAGAVTRCTRLSPGNAVKHLARTSFDFPAYAGRNLDTLAAVVAGASVARLRIGALHEAVAAVQGLVERALLEGPNGPLQQRCR